MIVFKLNLFPLRTHLLARFLSKKVHEKMKYLCVAEKNDAAKNIASILSRNNSVRREGQSKFNKIYEFDSILNGQNVKFVMTSVSGHLLNYAFTGDFKGWNSCNPIELFDAPIQKVCPDDYNKIKKTLEREIRGCQGLIIWTDGDREGENIGFEIIEVCTNVQRNLDVLRARFSEITPRSLNIALNNLERPNRNISDAVDVRMELDLRTGAAFTRLQTLRLQKVFPTVLNQKLISYGSCQFPTLGFVTERYKAVMNFIPETFWAINMSHTVKQITSEFAWDRDRLFDKTYVQALLAECLQRDPPAASVTDVQNKAKSKWRPLPLDTTEMEKSISRKLRINAKQVMKIAEKLYTQGLISYPRTETNVFPKGMNLGALVEAQRADANWGAFAARVFDEFGGPNPRAGKKSDQAHPPIHPLKHTDALVGNEKRVYEFIVRHFLACVSADAKGHETVVRARVEGTDETFTAKGLVILERNYLDVYIYENWNGKEIHDYKVGDTFRPTKLQLHEGKTSAPKLLTEADLIALMEKHGIGTDATHAEHIETIKSREYVELQQQIYFVPLPLGMGLVEGYNKMELQMSLAKPELRSEFENDLKLICEGRKSADEVRRDQVGKYRQVFAAVAEKMRCIDESLAATLNDEPQRYQEPNNAATSAAASNQRPVLKCPKCGKNMLVKQRANSASSWYLGCSGFPECKNAAWFAIGINSVEVTEDSCEDCGPNVKKVKVNFRQNPFIGEPNPNTLCIAGCDAAVLAALDIPTSAVKKLRNQTNNAPNIRVVTENSSNPSTSTNRNSFNSTTTNSSNTTRNSSNTTRNTSNATNRTSTTNRTNVSHTSTNNSNNYHPSSSSGSTNNSNNSNNRPRNRTSSENQTVCHCNKPAVKLTCRKDGPNKGREFYKCDDGSACNFFVWAQSEEESGHQNRTHNTFNNISNGEIAGSSSNNTNRNNSRNNNADRNEFREPTVVDCACGLRAVERTVRKEGPNTGKKFWCCSKGQQENKCNFFKWKEDGDAEFDNDSPRPGGSGNNGNRNGNWKNGGKGSKKRPANSTGSSVAKKPRTCGLCRQPGHNRKNCPNQD